ncbi:hypothetical protein AUJ66_00180 [Candidatus Desantisbacteria bacterium CG1_02_38_46]|uniref:RNA-binding protein KhpB n=1 Tax=Candidatus Desantisbacteria bacterium CG1_02_38_46 TaxID=1817893 RepID=A0A1J4SHU7_9BACT|nr:MAG: hypothetical protein AUJ66_00180 [Candidatus Desantisbacteria bacterium CG1_02_38_46]
MIVEQKGNSVDEAVEIALKKLGVPREKVKIEVIAEGKKGVFGLGSKLAIVRVTTIEEEEKQVRTSQEHRPVQTPEVSTKDGPKEPIPEEKSPAVIFLQEVFKSLGLEAKFQASITEDESQIIDIITSDSALLIGKKGKNLEALQYLTNIAANKNVSKRVKVLLDVERYRERREESLVTLAKKVADEVRQTGRSVSLEPMSAYERRIVHLALKEEPGIITESVGEGEERRVVIKMRKEG